MVPKIETPLRRLLETSSRFSIARLWENLPKIQDEHGHYSSDQRIDLFVNVIDTLLGLIMLILAFWVLAFVEKTTHRLGRARWVV
jgi:hypothetical protein